MKKIISCLALILFLFISFRFTNVWHRSSDKFDMVKTDIKGIVLNSSTNYVKPTNRFGSENVEVIVRDGILRDMEILSYDEFTGKVFNRAFANSHIVESGTGDPVELFHDIQDITLLPYNSGTDGKVLTLDGPWATIFYTGENVLETGINHYGERGSGNHQMMFPTGIAAGRDFSSGSTTTYPIYTCDYGNNRITKVSFVANPPSTHTGFNGGSYAVLNDSITFPYDIAYLSTNSPFNIGDRLWISQRVLDSTAAINCLDTSGNLLQTFVGYKSEETNDEYILTCDNKTRLAAYSFQEFYVLSFIDNVNNNLVTCLLDSNGQGETALGSNGENLIVATDVKQFDDEYPLNSVFIQSTSVLNRDWPNVWTTSGFSMLGYDGGISMVHALKVNAQGNVQYLASTERPINSSWDFKHLTNMAIVDQYSDIFTIEKWTDTYGIRKYLPYADIHSDTLYDYCIDNNDILQFRATFTNDCWIKISTQRKNKSGNWENVNIKKLNNDIVNNSSVVKYQRGGWNQSSSDLYINLQLDLPIDDYALGGEVKVNLKLYPEWADQNDLGSFPYSIVEEDYEAAILRSCLPQPGGCPFLHVLDESEEYRVDNNVLHRSEFSDSAVEIVDMYKIQVTPFVDERGDIEISLVENEDNITQVNYVKVFAVDRPANKKLAITESHQLVVYDSAQVTASDSVLFNGSDITNYLNYHNPGLVPIEGSNGDSIEAFFSYPPPLMIEHDRNSKMGINNTKKQMGEKSTAKNPTTKDKLPSQNISFISRVSNMIEIIPSIKDTSGVISATSIFSSTFSGYFTRREYPADIVLPIFFENDLMDNYKIKWQNDFNIKHLGVAYVDYSDYVVTEMILNTAFDTRIDTIIDVEAEVQSEDGTKAFINPSQFLKLVFDGSSLPSVKDGDVREYVIELKGYTINGKTRPVKDKINQLPITYSLSQNYPNPFNPTTKINFELPKTSQVSLIIYDILGREVIRLVNNEFKQAGRYTIDFNAQNFASGVYFYRIEAGTFVQSKKMVLVK